MDAEEQLLELIAADKWRMGVLNIIQDLDLPDWWVGAGFVRNAVWDHLHGFQMTQLNDIDVMYFEPEQTSEQADENLETELFATSPRKPWSVKNQARMHQKIGVEPFTQSLDALQHWPETATAIAVSLDSRGQPILASCYGLEDLWAGIIRPTSEERTELCKQRMEEKKWLKRWNKLRFEPALKAE